MSYLGKSHNLWHRMTLSLEKLAIDQQVQLAQSKARRDPVECYDFEPDLAPQQVSHQKYDYMQLTNVSLDFITT